MKKGFTVETREFRDYCEVLVVCNYKLWNLVVNYPFNSYNKEEIKPEDVGMWRIKQLKN
jgi:hypothetical protein